MKNKKKYLSEDINIQKYIEISLLHEFFKSKTIDVCGLNLFVKHAEGSDVL